MSRGDRPTQRTYPTMPAAIFVVASSALAMTPSATARVPSATA